MPKKSSRPQNVEIPKPTAVIKKVHKILSSDGAMQKYANDGDTSSVITTLKKASLAKIEQAIHILPTDRKLTATKYSSLILFLSCTILLINYLTNIQTNF